MKLINQNDYPNTIYVTKTKKPEPDRTSGLSTTIAGSGCGICCGIMVSQFFNKEMTMDEAIQLAYDYDANNGFGTKYKEYGNGLCDKLGLVCNRSTKKEDLFECLDNGGCVVVNVDGDHDDHIGVFSHVGHYIFVYKHVGDIIYILDPGIEPEKYKEEARKDKVSFEGEFVVSDVKWLLKDVENREWPFFLFKKKNELSSIDTVFNKIDELKDEFVNIWKQVVEIESPTSYKEGVDAVGHFFKEYATSNLWDVEVLENEVAGNALCITMNPNSKQKPVAISGHMDTVHPVGSFQTHIENNKIYGPGCTDCKGGLIVCLLAMKALKECGYINRPVKFILQSDEEVGSRLSNKKTIEFMCEKAKDCVCFLNTEMYNDGTAVTTRKGIRRYEMATKGRAAHSSVCNQGLNSILEMSYKIIELEKMKQADDITINVGTIEGGTTPNTVPENCKILIDVRFNNEEQMNEADEYIKNIANKTYVDGTSTTLTLISTRIAMDYKEYNTELLNKMNSIFSKCGLSQLTARKATGGSDAAYTSHAGIPSIDSIGVSGGYIHSKDEYANIDSLPENAKRMAAIIFSIE